jgi:hypothetical protein
MRFFSTSRNHRRCVSISSALGGFRSPSSSATSSASASPRSARSTSAVGSSIASARPYSYSVMSIPRMRATIPSGSPSVSFGASL